jgi:hypothetical protein
MSELFKSKLGWLLAGIYLLTVYSFLMYFYLIDRDGLSGFISFILSAPWSILLFYIVIPVVNGGQAPSYYNLSYIVAIVIGGLINAFILYLLVFLLTKAFKYLSSIKSKS